MAQQLQTRPHTPASELQAILPAPVDANPYYIQQYSETEGAVGTPSIISTTGIVVNRYAINLPTLANILPPPQAPGQLWDAATKNQVNQLENAAIGQAVDSLIAFGSPKAGRTALVDIVVPNSNPLGTHTFMMYVNNNAEIRLLDPSSNRFTIGIPAIINALPQIQALPQNQQAQQLHVPGDRLYQGKAVNHGGECDKVALRAAFTVASNPAINSMDLLRKLTNRAHVLMDSIGGLSNNIKTATQTAANPQLQMSSQNAGDHLSTNPSLIHNAYTAHPPLGEPSEIIIGSIINPSHRQNTLAAAQGAAQIPVPIYTPEQFAIISSLHPQNLPRHQQLGIHDPVQEVRRHIIYEITSQQIAQQPSPSVINLIDHRQYQFLNNHQLQHALQHDVAPILFRDQAFAGQHQQIAQVLNVPLPQLQQPAIPAPAAQPQPSRIPRLIAQPPAQIGQQAQHLPQIQQQQAPAPAAQPQPSRIPRLVAQQAAQIGQQAQHPPQIQQQQVPVPAAQRPQSRILVRPPYP